jgi:apolipoprotein D and lipocalin family protein
MRYKTSSGAFMLALSLILTGCSCAQDKNRINMNVVKNVKLGKYLGTWYEIARFDHSFERGLEGVTATYTLRPDGKIDVLNQGCKNTLNGKHSMAKGIAKIPNPAEPGKLKVAFFLFFYAAYNILELDENYQWALIGSSSDKYLWILSRTPQMNPETYAMLLKKAKERGYDVSKLIKVVQPEK